MRTLSAFIPRLLTLLLVAAATATAVAQPERVDEILRAPADYLDEIVTIEGFVENYVDSPASSTSFYYLRDDFGDLIRVRTTRPAPSVGDTRYRVTGPVGMDPRLRDPFISEESRVDLTTTPPPPRGGETLGLMEWVLIGAIALVLLALLGVLVWVLRQNRQPAAAASAPPPTPTGSATSLSTGNGASEPVVLEDKTIKMHAPSSADDKTLKLLKGRLIVTKGTDDIKEVRFYREADASGIPEVTFGRSPGRPYHHVQLKPRTVSSKQAALRFQNGDTHLVNFASERSNPTRVNGRPLEEKEDVPLADGDQIEMGEVEFKYSAN